MANMRHRAIRGEPNYKIIFEECFSVLLQEQF